MITSYYLKAKLTRNLKFSIIVGAIGVILSATSVLITDIPESDTLTFLISTLIVLVSGLTWGGYAIVSSEFYQKSINKDNSNPIIIFAVSNFFSVLVIALAMGITNQIPDITYITNEAWLSVIYLALGSTTIAFGLYIYASKSIPPTTINIILLFNVIIGIILSAILLGEILSILMIIGSFLIIIAIYLAGKEEIVINNQ